MPLEDHCRKRYATVGAEDSVRDVARLMLAENEGCAFVLDDRGRPIGTLTDRDIALQVLRRRRDADATKVEDVMERQPTTLWHSASLLTGFRRMRHDGLRRIPVVDDARCMIGVLEWDDALQIIAEELQHAARVAQAQHSAPANQERA